MGFTAQSPASALLAVGPGVPVHIDSVLDLRGRPPRDYYAAIMEAVRRLDGRQRAWRLAIRVDDTPEVACELPSLLAHLLVVGLDREVTRDGDAGSQTVILTRT